MRRLLMSLMVVLAAASLTGGASAQMAPLPKPAAGQAVATFAGGCFWCTESDFDKCRASFRPPRVTPAAA